MASPASASLPPAKRGRRTPDRSCVGSFSRRVRGRISRGSCRCISFRWCVCCPPSRRRLAFVGIFVGFSPGLYWGGVIVHGPVADYGIVLVGLLVAWRNLLGTCTERAWNLLQNLSGSVLDTCLEQACELVPEEFLFFLKSHKYTLSLACPGLKGQHYNTAASTSIPISDAPRRSRRPPRRYPSPFSAAAVPPPPILRCRRRRHRHPPLS